MIILEIVSIVLWIITSVSVLPLYLSANGTRPLIFGYVVILAVMGITVIIDLFTDGTPPADCLVARICVMLAIAIPALIVMVRTGNHTGANANHDHH